MSALIQFWFQPHVLELGGVDEHFIEQLDACGLLPACESVEEAAAYLRRMRRIRQLYEDHWEALELIEHLRREVITWQQRYYELKTQHQQLQKAYEQLWQLWRRGI